MLPGGTKPGQMRIEVIFDIDGNRNLTVTAFEQSSGRCLQAKISNDWLSKVNYHEHPSSYAKGT